jgi:hypothetical protein
MFNLTTITMKEFDYKRIKKNAVDSLNKENERKESAELFMIRAIGGSILGCIILVLLFILAPNLVFNAQLIWDGISPVSQFVIIGIIGASVLTFILSQTKFYD